LKNADPIGGISEDVVDSLLEALRQKDMDLLLAGRLGANAHTFLTISCFFFSPFLPSHKLVKKNKKNKSKGRDLLDENAELHEKLEMAEEIARDLEETLENERTLALEAIRAAKMS